MELASNYGANKLGKYIVRVDADDMLEEDYLSNVEKEICSSKDIITDYWEIDKNGKNLSVVKLPVWREETYNGEIFSHWHDKGHASSNLASK